MSTSATVVSPRSGPRATVYPQTAAQEHWLYRAHANPAACELADRLKLSLPAGRALGVKATLRYPVERLVCTGEDTPENFQTLFGEQWREGVLKKWEEIRVDMVVAPPIRHASSHSPLSSYPSRKNSLFTEDETVPWCPRPPTERERRKSEELQELRREFGVY